MTRTTDTTPAGAAHAPAVMVRDPRRLTNRYSNKNWSGLFQCPTCGRRVRQNLNFLGSRNELVCDGVRSKRQRKHEARHRWTAAGFLDG